MKTNTIYVNAVLIPQTDVACFAIAAGKSKGKKLDEFTGTFQSKGRVATQLKAMIHGINSTEEAETLEVYTDSAVFDNFADGTVGTWELADWCKGNGQTIDHADLWQELNALVEKKSITFRKGKTDKTMSVVNNLLKKAKKNPQPFMTLNLGALTEKYAHDTTKIQEVPENLIEIKELESEIVAEKTETTAKTKRGRPARKNKISEKVATIQENIEIPLEVAPVIMEKPAKKSRKKQEVTTKSQEKEVTTALPAIALEIGETSQKPAGLVVDVDEKTKKECDKFFAELGLDTETAVKIFLKQSLRSKSIPFDLKLN